MYTMFWSRIAWPALAASFATSVNGQQSGWAEGQVNATMCTWNALRAATLKDTVYLDGGYLFWVPGMADESYGLPTQDNNPLGLIYTLNFSTPFNATSNYSTLLNTISKAPNGGAANNLAPNYYDGALLANDDELFLYGGLLTRTESYSSPDADEVLGYRESQYGAEKGGFHPGFVNAKLPDNVTRYLTYGGAANAPSEKKAWYFGGYRSPSWGPIYYPSANSSLNPTNVSNTLITLDMTTQQQEKWTNTTLPSNIPSRANPSVVWVPVGAQGILVVLGGVSYPNYNNPTLKSQNEAQSESDSPNYMENVDIYDIANGEWYSQPTVAAPPALALGCAVVAPAQDFSSYNIYYYGGYNGIDGTADFNDDVWILSLPSFMWMKVSSGKPDHARAGHQCVMPYPDQMITIGGYTAAKGTSTCLNGGILEIFNLTEGKWMDSYDPENWGEYGVPEMVHLMIGGDFTGGATMATPTPTGWATPELASVFATTYPAEKLITHYPYTGTGPGDVRGDYDGSSGGTPSWVAPVLGVVLGLVFLTAVVVAILLYRRRKLLRKNGGSQNPTDDNRHRILSWVRGQTNDKAPTVTTEDPSSWEDMESRGVTPMRTAGQPGQPEMKMVQHHEMPDTPLVELMDTSPRFELGDTGLTPVDIINKHSHFATAPNSPHSVSTPTNPSASFFTGSVSRDHASSISSSQIPPPPPPPQQQQHRPDSISLGGNRGGDSSGRAVHGVPGTPPPPPPPRNAVNSGVSAVSERDAAHLRQYSNTSVSSSGTGMGTAANGPSPPNSPPPPQHAQSHSHSHSHGYNNNNNNSIDGPLMSPPLPVSPPSVGAGDGRDAPDYVSVHGHSQGQGDNRQGRRGQSPLGRNPTEGGGGGSGNGNGGGATSSPLRRSVFRESTDDLGDSGR